MPYLLLAALLVGVSYSAAFAESPSFDETRDRAEKGEAEAQTNLGVMYLIGKGVPRDDAEAAKWYRKAAEQGDASAQNNLGAMYAEGKGVPRDYVTAYMWFALAAAQGLDSARASLDRLETILTPTQREEAQRLEREWTAAHTQ